MSTFVDRVSAWLIVVSSFIALGAYGAVGYLVLCVYEVEVLVVYVGVLVSVFFIVSIGV